jgi:hypothetical protein
MKLGKLGLAIAAVACGLCLQPSIGWSSRLLPPPITGTVTATPSSGTIEVDYRSYHVRANSAASRALSSIHVGEIVDIVWDGLPNSSNIEVTSIVHHQG